MELSQALEVFGYTSLDGVTLSTLKQSYRTLAKQRHPDKEGGGSKQFIQLQSAYVTLRRELGTYVYTKPETKEQEVPATQKKYTHYQPHQAESEETQTKNEDLYQTSTSNDQKKTEEESSIHASKEHDTTQIKPQFPSITELQLLSRDELVDKYYEDTRDLQVRIGNLMSEHHQYRVILTDVQDKVTELSKDYQDQMSKLQSSLQHQIEGMEKNIIHKMWMKIFLTPITGKDAWSIYQEKVSKYKEKRLKLQTEFNEKLVGIYGESLNNMMLTLTSSSE